MLFKIYNSNYSRIARQSQFGKVLLLSTYLLLPATESVIQQIPLEGILRNRADELLTFTGTGMISVIVLKCAYRTFGLCGLH